MRIANGIGVEQGLSIAVTKMTLGNSEKAMRTVNVRGLRNLMIQKESLQKIYMDSGTVILIRRITDICNTIMAALIMQGKLFNSF